MSRHGVIVTTVPTTKYKHTFHSTVTSPTGHPTTSTNGNGPEHNSSNTSLTADCIAPGEVYTHKDNGTDLEGSPSITFLTVYASTGPRAGKSSTEAKDTYEKTECSPSTGITSIPVGPSSSHGRFTSKKTRLFIPVTAIRGPVLSPSVPSARTTDARGHICRSCPPELPGANFPPTHATGVASLTSSGSTSTFHDGGSTSSYGPAHNVTS